MLKASHVLSYRYWKYLQTEGNSPQTILDWVTCGMKNKERVGKP